MTDLVSPPRGMVERSLRFAQARAFCAVLTRGSFSEAARALGVTQPAITAQIRSLEELAGGRLFHRGGGPVELTALGRELAGPLRRLTQGLDDIEMRLAGMRDLSGAMLALGICGPYLAMPLIEAFVLRYPGVRITTRLSNSTDLITAVSEQLLDAAIVTLQAPVPDLFNVLVTIQRVTIAARLDHPCVAHGRIRLADLAEQPLITREPGSMTRRVFEDGLAKMGIQIEARWEFGSREAVKEAVAQGLGVGIVLDQEFGRDDRLAMLTIEDASFSAGEYLICPPGLADLGAVGAFVDVARSWARPAT